MKAILNKPWASALLAVAIVALMAMTMMPASAAPLTVNYAADNGKVFQIEHVVSLEKAPGAIVVKQQSGTNLSLPDATGAVWAKVKSSAFFAASYVQVPGTNRYMNTRGVTEISCIGSQSVFSWPISPSQPEYFQDGCALHAVVKASSN